MNKLNGTSGQLFSMMAKTVTTRGTARSAESSGGQASEDASFQDLLHTVSNLAKRALSDQGHEGPVKPGVPRTRVTQLTERDEAKDETIRERPKAAEEPDSSKKSGAPELAAKVDVPSRVILPFVVGQELAAVPVARPQAPPAGGTNGAAPARMERSSTARELPRMSIADATKADVAEGGTRPSATLPQAATEPKGNAALPKGASAVPGFEGVAANVERAAKVSGREVLPEATRVTVVQQETHLPPVPQFSATQQVANAVVGELKGSSVSASSAASGLVSSQSNAPDQPLKILTISLEPPALGNVTVRLRLVGAEVSVHLAAERRDTSQMLEQQRDSIRELMQSAGYVADVAPVRHGALDGFQAGSGQSQLSLAGQQQQSQQSQGAFDGSSTSSGQPDGEPKQGRQERQPNQETRHDQDVASHNRRGAVYL
jgi:chemotaxis protein MotD